jgi:MSHA biogenesis protein MshI
MMGRLFSFLSPAARHTGTAGLTLAPTGGALVVLDAGADGARQVRHAHLLADADPEGLKQAVRAVGAEGLPCSLTLEQGSYSVLQVERPTVNDEELATAVRWRIKDMIDFPLEEAILDVFDIPGLEQRGRPPSVYVAVARRAHLMPRVEAIKESGLELTRIGITELALRNFVALLTDTAESVGVLYLGRERGLFAICRQAALYVARHVEHGLQDLESGPEEPEADGIALAARAEAQERIALEVQRTLDYYDSYFAQPAVRRIYVVPPTPAAAGGLAESLRASLGIEARAEAGTALSGAPAWAESPQALLAACGAVDETEFAS